LDLPGLTISKDTENVPETHLVMKDEVESCRKTKEAVCFLRNLRLGMTSKRSVPLCEQELARAIIIFSSGDPVSPLMVLSMPSEIFMELLCLM
jgi:hypothetical protein